MPSSREFLKFLSRQGYLRARQSGSHLILEHPERRILSIPIHRGDIPKGLFLRILKDAGFTLQDFHAK